MLYSISFVLLKGWHNLNRPIEQHTSKVVQKRVEWASQLCSLATWYSIAFHFRLPDWLSVNCIQVNLRVQGNICCDTYTKTTVFTASRNSRLPTLHLWQQATLTQVGAVIPFESILVVYNYTSMNRAQCILSGKIPVARTSTADFYMKVLTHYQPKFTYFYLFCRNSDSLSFE